MGSGMLSSRMFKKIHKLIKTNPKTSLFTLGLVILWYWFSLPNPLFDKGLSFVLESADGSLLGAQIAEDGQWRFPTQDTVPDKFATAIITFEDKRFYRHPGVDLISLARAFRQNIQQKRIVSGGSTLSMQVIRMAKDNPPRTIIRKIQEIILATRLELGYTKTEILNLYAANAPFGGNVVGLEAASWRYFAKPPNLLSWAETCMLAVLPNSPALIHPGRNRTALKEKRNRLLKKLLEKEHIDATTYALSIEEPLPDAPHPLPRLAPHLLSRAKKERASKGFRLRTTVDMALQRQLNELASLHLQRLSQNEIHNLGILILEVETGNTLAYVGNAPATGATHAEEVDVLVAPRSTGSILKPFLYAQALQDGIILPKTYLPDIPMQLGGYRPVNFYEDYDGMVAAERALVRSLNVPMIWLLQQQGLEAFHYQLKKMGLSTIVYPPAHYGLPLILGGAEGTLWDITGAYAKMARTLNHYPNYNARYIQEDAKGGGYNQKELSEERKTLQSQPVFLSASSIWFTFQAMQKVERPGTEGDWSFFESSRKIAWKTGTSFGFRDAWAVGVNPQYAVGVWVGNADGEGRPGLVGISAAAPLLFDVFNRLPGDDVWFEPPYDDMKKLETCSVSGYRAGENCPVDTSWCPASGVKVGACPFHELIHVDEAARWRVHKRCWDEVQTRAHFVLPPVEEFYYKQKNPEYQLLPPMHPKCMDESEEQNMQLIYPKYPTRIYVPIDLDGEQSKTIFKVAHRLPDITIHWHLDEYYLGSTTNFHSKELSPPVGKHLLTLVDANGNRLEQPFEIIGKE